MSAPRINLAQHTGTATASAATATATYTNPQTQGNINTACIVSNTPGIVTNAVTDSAGNAYQKISSNATQSAGGGEVSIWWTPNSINTNSSNTVTATLSGTSSTELYIQEWSYIDVLGPTNTSSNTVSANLAGGTVTTAQASLVLAAFSCTGNFSTATNGYIALDTGVATNACMYQIFTVKGARTATGTEVSGNGWDNCTASFYYANQLRASIMPRWL